ncbi:hypothetical protein SDC9_113295 [bioreactor metagenome]|uniref:Uncharacterized protein n=1 Tax=bioreactor metagenome TaxID=1076179 RepID=A0A645BMP0_9ZZZZ
MNTEYVFVCQYFSYFFFEQSRGNNSFFNRLFHLLKFLLLIDYPQNHIVSGQQCFYAHIGLIGNPFHRHPVGKSKSGKTHPVLQQFLPHVYR